MVVVVLQSIDSGGHPLPRIAAVSLLLLHVGTGREAWCEREPCRHMLLDPLGSRKRAKVVQGIGTCSPRFGGYDEVLSWRHALAGADESEGCGCSLLLVDVKTF